MCALHMDYCPRCDAQNPEGTAACQRCGAPMTQGTMMMGAAFAPRLDVTLRVVRADGGPEIQVPMRGEQLLCGRHGDVSFAEDPFVAETQARFFFSAGKLAVEDVGGGNGVFVRLRHEHEVNAGMELRLGRQRLLVEPLPPASPGAGGVMQWGSPDEGAPYRLVQLLEGGMRGAAFALRPGENHLGRDQGDVTFPGDGFVSGRHAVLTVRENAQLTVRDVGSSNGTFLRLNAPVFVEDGDQFLMGRELVRIEVKPMA